MINLLPPEVKTGYSYGRRNVGLRKWVIILVIALIGLGAIATFGLLTLKQSSKQYQDQIAASQGALTKDQYEATQKRVKDMSGSFKLVIQVLSQEMLFSELLKQMGAVMPDNSSLTSLNINQIKGGLDISAVAADYNTATQVQVNLSDPNNKIFSKADIIGITCEAKQGATVSAKYPCTVNIRALFSNNNPFLFINSKGTK